jgi:hypothetical protein
MGKKIFAYLNQFFAQCVLRSRRFSAYTVVRVNIRLRDVMICYYLLFFPSVLSVFAWYSYSIIQYKIACKKKKNLSVITITMDHPRIILGQSYDNYLTRSEPRNETIDTFGIASGVIVRV